MSWLAGPRYVLKYRVLGHPLLFPTLYPLLRTRKDKSIVVSRTTEIVIEGFPRSGNSFAVIAFQHAQARPVSIAHHLHHEAQVLVGVRWGLPVLVLIREPADAIASLLLRDPATTVTAALRRYIEFHTRIARVSDRIVIANFKDVVHDFGAVIDRINAKFGTSFKSFRHTPESERRVFEQIEYINRTLEGGNQYMLASPSKARQAAYQEMHLSMPQALKDEAYRLHALLG